MAKPDAQAACMRTCAGLIGAAGVVVSLAGIPALSAQSLAQSSTAAGLAGFPDIVDAVRSSVIGVRTEVANAGRPGGSGLRGGGSFDQPPASGDSGDTPKDPDQRGGPSSPHGGRLVMTQGSGFFISADGYAVTNGHVVGESRTVEIETAEGKTYAAKVVGNDPVSDLALLKVEGEHDFTPAELASNTPRVGEWVLAIGNPFGLGGTVTAGIISARNRNIAGSPYGDFLQIDAPVNQGNSGGPTFSLDGKVIGVNTMIVSPTGGSIGIAFAIPIETLTTVIPQLKDKGFVTRGWLGVRVAPVTPDTAENLGLEKVRGAVIAEAQVNGPAARAGLAGGDVVTSLNGEPVKDAHELVKKIGSMSPGSAVKLGVRRNGEDMMIVATLGELPVKRLPRSGMIEQKQKAADAGGSGVTRAVVVPPEAA
jgi:serine protease Do